jgi:transcriptional regulator
MPARNERLELLQGTLDMLILRTLALGPEHGHGISTRIGRSSRSVLTVEHGSLYPALHRLQRDGYVTARWERAPERNREFKYYHLTAAGRRRLRHQQSKWDELVRAIARVMRPVAEG